MLYTLVPNPRQPFSRFPCLSPQGGEKLVQASLEQAACNYNLSMKVHNHTYTLPIQKMNIESSDVMGNAQAIEASAR